MSLRRPPTLALWLLEHAWVGAYREALIGDLIEHYQTGRSRWWFWRQVGYALVIASIPSTLQKLLAVFGLVALGAGTFAWASAEQHGDHEARACAHGTSSSSTGARGGCTRSNLP
jgi:hypothetical protein